MKLATNQHVESASSLIAFNKLYNFNLTKSQGTIVVRTLVCFLHAYELLNKTTYIFYIYSQNYI